MFKHAVWILPVLLFCGMSDILPAQAVVAQPLRRAPHHLPDADGDGMPDAWESVFHVDPTKTDTDGDTFDDWKEVILGFNPAGKGPWTPQDTDGDGLDDRFELLFNVDPTVVDSDFDGHSDGEEVAAGFFPDSATTTRMMKELRIVVSKQDMQQRIGGVTIATYKVSTGVTSTPTPLGEYSVRDKNPRAWSRVGQLWMPWWMGFSGRGHGIHELPEWPGGKKEGADHLGKPASHGCVRLGVGPAKILYDWAPIGTKVTVVR